jgi:acetyl esterase/lipase
VRDGSALTIRVPDSYGVVMVQVVPVVYGSPPRWGDLSLPRSPGPHPVVVLVHGGYWRSRYSRHLMRWLAYDLARRGFAAWNISYRGVDEPGGGWPGTLQDVAVAVDLLAALSTCHCLDLGRVVSLGHSAGGQLSLWLAARPGLPAGAPGAGPRVRVCAAVSQAGVVDLAAADAADLSHGATAALLGGSAEQVPARYRLASPIERLPLGVPQLVLHGQGDTSVPIAQSRGYVSAARAAGDPVELVEFPDTGHFEMLRPAAQQLAHGTRPAAGVARRSPGRVGG